MEPFRPVVDYLTKSFIADTFEKEQKQKILQLLQFKILINNRRETVQNAISIFVYSILDYLLDSEAEIKTPIICFDKHVL